MQIALISNDPRIYALCNEIVTRNFGREASVSVCCGEARESGADLCIWDFHPAAAIPEDIPGDPCRHLFLVQRADLEAFSRRGLPAARILLKPVTPAVLEAFLAEHARPHGPAYVNGNPDETLPWLGQVNLTLQQYDQERTNFLARAIHDFRAPLTALTGYCGLLLGGELGALSGTQQEVLRRIEQSTKRLSRLAGEMFQLSVSGRVDPRPNLEAAEVRDCLAQAIHEIRPRAEEKGIQVSLHCSPSVETLYFEPSQMEQVLVNLLDNACKHTPAGGHIEIASYPYFWERRQPSGPQPVSERRRSDVCAPNAYRVDVQDSGPGIPRGHLNCIFEEYVSAERAGQRSGAGLGLAICKRIMQRHQGCVWAESNGRGAKFSLVLPLGGACVASSADTTAKLRVTAPEAIQCGSNHLRQEREEYVAGN